MQKEMHSTYLLDLKETHNINSTVTNNLSTKGFWVPGGLGPRYSCLLCTVGNPALVCFVTCLSCYDFVYTVCNLFTYLGLNEISWKNRVYVKFKFIKAALTILHLHTTFRCLRIPSLTNIDSR